MNSLFAKVSAGILALVLLCYVGYQTFNLFYTPYVVEIVRPGSYTDEIPMDGFFVRSETELPLSKTGAIQYQYQNAQKVSKGAVIASVYEKQEDLQYLREAEGLQKQREILLSMQDKASMQGMQLSLLNAKLRETRLELIRQADEEDYASLSDTLSGMMTQLNKLTVCLNESADFSPALRSVETQLAAVEGKTAAPLQTLTVDRSGYFSNQTDGYEAVLSPDMLETVTVDQAVSILEGASPSDTNAVGKLVEENFWYYVAVIPAEYKLNLETAIEQGRSFPIVFDSMPGRSVTVKPERVGEERDGRFVAVFRGNTLDKDLINLRFESAQLLWQEYTGVLIPKKAIRMRQPEPESGSEDTYLPQVKGVYVMYGKTVRFRQVDVLYEDETYIISRIHASGYVNAYDSVVVEGKGLDENAI